MKKTIYISFDVEAESYQEAEQTVKEILQDCSNTLEQYKEVLDTKKFVNKVKI